MLKPRGTTPLPRLHKQLHLQHHQHTGRVLHHRHTSYRGLAIVILLASTVIVGLNIMSRVAADTYTVYARNPAPIPTTASVITSPANNTVVTKARLLISGTCEALSPATIITILDNGQVAGSTPCQDGTFSLLLVIEQGRHAFLARTYTITDDTGPDSNTVIVFRIADTTTVAGDTDEGQKVSGTPLVVIIDRPFIIFGPAKDAVWVGTITGGTLPYRVAITWDNGDTATYTVTEAGQHEFAHHYHVMRPHVIGFRVSDAGGRSIVRQYAAVTPYLPPVYPATPVRPWNGSLPLGLYGAYLLLLVVFGGLWTRGHQFAYTPVPVRRRTTAKHPRPRGRG